MSAHWQPFTTALRAVWDFSDSQSGIHHVTWSVRVHHDETMGLQPVDSAYVTSADEGVRSNLRLFDGDLYYLSLHVCNGAGMCLLADEVSSHCKT